MSADEDELAELRRERMEELQEQQGGGADEEAIKQQQEAAEQQRKAILRQYLTDGARQRLNTLKMSKPDRAEQIEQQMVGLAQSGRINGKIDEEQMKELLRELSPDSKSFNVRHR